MVLYAWLRKDNWLLLIIIVTLLGNNYVTLDLVINLNIFTLKVGITGFVPYNSFSGDLTHVTLDSEIYQDWKGDKLLDT